MPHDRFYLNADLSSDAQVELSSAEAHHLKVMRIQKGEIIELINGRNVLAQAKITEIEKHRARAEILSIITRDPGPPIILCQALPRPNRLDTIIEKGTELGMTELRLFPGERSEKKNLSETQLERFNAQIIASIKQCGRLDLPKIVLYPPLSQWKTLDKSHPAFFGDPNPSAPHFSTAFKKNSGLYFFVGPESGFSDGEKKIFSHLGVVGVRLHPNILRTDTASLVALSLIHFQ